MKIFDFSYIYNFLIVLSIFFSFLVISSKNPVHSIIFLICVFFNIFFILFLQDLEYLSIVFLIIYVGAVAILFLFVIYMLNIKVIELRELNSLYLIGLCVCFILVLLLLLFFFIKPNFIIYKDVTSIKNFYYINWLNFIFDYDNLSLIAFCLYNDFGIIVVIVGLILLVAVIGSVVINLNYVFYKKDQNTFKQIKRLIK